MVEMEKVYFDKIWLCPLNYTQVGNKTLLVGTYIIRMN